MIASESSESHVIIIWSRVISQNSANSKILSPRFTPGHAFLGKAELILNQLNCFELSYFTNSSFTRWLIQKGPRQTEDVQVCFWNFNYN